MSMTFRETKLMCKGVLTKAKIATTSEYHFIESSFGMKDELKAMKGAKWMGRDLQQPMPVWRVVNCPRNQFALDYLEGKNPYSHWKRELVIPKDANFRIRDSRVNAQGVTWNLYGHQKEMALQILLKRQVVIAGEMGVGKTLSVFEAAELSLVPEIWYVGPKSAITSVQLEAYNWKFRVAMRYITYDGLKTVLATWPADRPPPTFIWFDECSRLKNPTSQRTQAALYLCDQMRAAYGLKAYIVLTSGSPSPKDPVDWWSQCEAACPGYIREGTPEKLRERLAIVKMEDGLGGYKYPKVLGWRDGNPNTCNHCGQKPDTPIHEYDPSMEGLFGNKSKGLHPFVPVTNEVNKLYTRMSGLVYVKLKKECLDLPDKIYREVKCRPTADMIRAARMVAAKGTSVIETMTLLRELSDGFQYETKQKPVPCPRCNGNCTEANPCELCGTAGTKLVEERVVVEVPTPKLEALNDLLEECEDDGRIVVYAGFTASIDRVCKYVKDRGWHFIRVDGRGWNNSLLQGWNAVEMNRAFQDRQNVTDKIAFVGHPGSAGMGLTLTASNMICYYSNDFNAESRIQSEDRIHRAGMDVNRGATIVDLLHLPTDKKVLLNLKRKRELQSVTLNEITAALSEFDTDAPMVT